MSPAAAASAAVAARARGPSSPTRSARVSGPRLLLRTTSWPAATASRAMVLPMFPLPMSPTVVTYAASRAPAEPFPARASSRPGSHRETTRPPGSQPRGVSSGVRDVVGALVDHRVRARRLLVGVAAADQPRLQVLEAAHRAALQRLDPVAGVPPQPGGQLAVDEHAAGAGHRGQPAGQVHHEIGRASWRER